MNEKLKNILQGYIEFDIVHLEGTELSSDDAGCTRYGLNTKYDGLSCEELQNMTIDKAIQIYYNKLSDIFLNIYNQTQSIKLALMYLDIMNLQGQSQAERCLRFAMRGMTEEDRVNRMTYIRMMKLFLLAENNENLNKYLDGWLNRAFKVYRYIYNINS